MKAAFVYTAIGIVVIVVLLQLYFMREGFFASSADKLIALNKAITLCTVSGKTSDCKIAAGNGGDLSDGTNVPGVAMSLDSSDVHGCNSLDVSMNDNTYLTNILRIRQVSNATILTALKCIKAGFTASATAAATAAAAAATAAAKAARDAAAAKVIKDAADAATAKAAADVITTAKAASDAAAAATVAAAAYATAKAAADADPTNSAKATAADTAKAASDSAALLSVTAAQAAAAAAKVVKDAKDAKDAADAAADAADDADDADATDASGNLITLSLSDLFYALRFGNTNTETTKKKPTLLPKSTTTHSFSEEEKNRLSKDIAKNIKDQLLSDRSLDFILPASNDSCANDSACVSDSCSQGADYMSGAPFNANDFIRKDSIPCYGCTLPK